MSAIDSMVSACEFFRNIDEIAKQRDDEGKMNGTTVKNTHDTKSYINEQPAANPSNYESKPTSLSDPIDVINRKIEQAPEYTEETVDKSLEIHGNPSLKIDIQDNTIGLENLRKRQHPDGSNESVNKKTKQEFTTSEDLTTDVAKLLKMKDDTVTIEWEEMLLRIIHHHIMSQLQQGPKLLDIMEIYINECIEKDPDFENKQLSLQCDESTADVDKYTLLLYLAIKKNVCYDYIAECTNIPRTTASNIINGLQKCTPNLYIILVSYKIYTARNALTVKRKNPSEKNQLFTCLNIATASINKVPVFNLIIDEHIGSDIRLLYKTALQRKQEIEQKSQLYSLSAFVG